uniref:Uncharacterized protein n=1 Tax=Trichogramma kaykai TaxID=54128 RepID=A0ABD2WDQ9_9HYME
MHLNFSNGTSCRRRQGTWGCSWLVATLALALLLCAEAVSSLDLGPIVRVAQCRSQCLKRHSLDGSCEWWRHGETGCNELCASFAYNNGVRLRTDSASARPKKAQRETLSCASCVCHSREAFSPCSCVAHKHAYVRANGENLAKSSSSLANKSLNQRR